jgi:hypothetical protein
MLWIQSTLGRRNAPPRPGWLAVTPSSWYRLAWSVLPPNTWPGRAPGVNWMRLFASRGVGRSSRSRSPSTVVLASVVARWMATGLAVTCTAESSVTERSRRTASGVTCVARSTSPRTSTGRKPTRRARATYVPGVRKLTRNVPSAPVCTVRP